MDMEFEFFFSDDETFLRALPSNNAYIAGKKHVEHILCFVADFIAETFTNHHMPINAILFIHCLFNRSRRGLINPNDERRTKKKKKLGENTEIVLNHLYTSNKSNNIDLKNECGKRIHLIYLIIVGKLLTRSHAQFNAFRFHFFRHIRVLVLHINRIAPCDGSRGRSGNVSSNIERGGWGMVKKNAR